MIRYDKLWHTMKERGISQYDLYHRFHISRSQIHRLRKNENVQVNTLDRLCNIWYFFYLKIYSIRQFVQKNRQQQVCGFNIQICGCINKVVFKNVQC